MKVAILITCHNRKEKTLRCLSSIRDSLTEGIEPKVFLTDDGCSDRTGEAVTSAGWGFPVKVLQGDGDLFWNGGMILAWKAALDEGGFDGYLWINDDITVLPEFWTDLAAADAFCLEKYGKRGIYAGSTKDADNGKFTYGGFIYTSKFTLKDKLIEPDGKNFIPCEAAHGNITYVAAEVVEKTGIFCEKYIHGGSDHDYTYLAHKAGFPILVLPHYSASCENDHLGKTRDYTVLPFRERCKLFYSPKGYNMHNTLLFNRRCFPWRVPFVWMQGITKLLFPKLGYGLYLRLRGVKKNK